MTLTQISTDGVKNDAISHNKIPANAIQASELADNAVDTAAIADDAVTNAKMADNSVNSNNYVDGSINTAHIADANVTTAKIADDAVTDAKLANSINSAIAANTAKASVTINTNADNRVLTGTGTANTIQGESQLLFDSNGHLYIKAPDGGNRYFFGGSENTNPAELSLYDASDAQKLRLGAGAASFFTGGNVGIGTNSPSTSLSVVNDSQTEGFNVKHSDLTQGLGIGYDTIKSTGSAANVALKLRSKGDGHLTLGFDATTVAEIESPERNFKIHGNHQGWSTLVMDDNNYGWRKHYRRVNNGQNSVSTHDIARIKCTNWGWGYYELRIYISYYFKSHVSIGYLMGHGNGADHYSVKRKDEKFTDTNTIGWGAEIQKGTVSSSSPGSSNARYIDLQCTLPNYTYAVAEFIAYSSYKMSDSDMAGTADCYRLFQV